MYVVTSMLGLASMLEVLPLTRRVSRSRLLKGGATVNTTLCRTHELKSGDRRRPETERQGLAPRPSHDSRVASKEFVTHRVRYTGTARPNPIIGAPGVVTCASSLRCELHSRLQSPQVTTEDCPKKLNILSFALASDAGDTHTPVTDRWDCPPPPPALLTQDSMPRERRHLAGVNWEGGSVVLFFCALGGMFSRRPWPSEVSY